MFFTVIPYKTKISPSNRLKAFLTSDSWNDYGYCTWFSLTICDEIGKQHLLGGVKIGQFGMKEEKNRPQIPNEFDELDQTFFSLGQSDGYYEKLKKLSSELQNKVFDGLRDIVADLSRFDKAINEDVTKVSLLRGVTPMTVRGQFRRLVTGGARLSRYDFSYEIQNDSDSKILLDFHVKPESNPPTNIHVLIGRNGVGKTRILNCMACSLVYSDSQNGVFTLNKINDNNELFANLVSVTFSAFDEFKPLREKKDKTDGIKYSYVGLKNFENDDEKNMTPKTPQMLANEFVSSVQTCRQEAKIIQWKKSLKMLEADPIFQEADVVSLAEDSYNETFTDRANNVFKNLSSGHKIVLLTITRLVELVEERTLVLLDEPEAHLHPPLLSAFVRSLSELLVYRNGVAIIATHSPVILQEVPRSCVWKLRRIGSKSIAERPEIETFGENVGILTREVFGLEVTQSGFHKLIQVAVEKGNNFNDTMGMFDNELGAEARAILRALIIIRDSETET